MIDDPNKSELHEAPDLRRIPKVDPFVTPIGFFETFPHRVQAEVVLRTRSRSTPILVRRVMAVGFLVLILVAAFLWQRNERIAPAPILAGPAIQEDDLLDEELLWLDEEELYRELASSQDIPIQPGNGFTHEELGAYLEYSDLPLIVIAEQP